MNVSSAHSSYASQTLQIRPPQQENIQQQATARDSSPAASPASNAAPTVNTSGQTVGQLINVSA